MLTKFDPEDTRRLRSLIPLTSLSGSKFDELCTRIRIESGEKGTVLFRQGDKKNEFVYLLTGTISLRAGEVEMDVIEGETETSRFALAHQLPRKINAVATSKIRYVRIDSRLLYSTDNTNESSSGYKVTDLPEESSSDWMTTLLKSPIFQRLPASNLQKIIINLEEVEFEKGEEVIRQGESGDYYYIIKEGRCILTRKPNPQSKEIKLAQLKSCDTFGEDALISGQPRNVSISMITPGIMLRLKKDKFLELIKAPIIENVEFSSLKNEIAKGDMLVDIRSPDAFEENHLQNSRNVPFFSLRVQMHTFDRNQRTILVCENGRSSEAAAFLLIRNELDAVVLRGGIQGVPKDVLVRSDQNSLFGLKKLFADNSTASSSTTDIPDPTNKENQTDENREVAIETAQKVASVTTKSKDLAKHAVNPVRGKSQINDWLAKNEEKATHLENDPGQPTMVLDKEIPVAEVLETECAANTTADAKFQVKVNESQPAKPASPIQPIYEKLTQTSKANDIPVAEKERQKQNPDQTETGSPTARNNPIPQKFDDTEKFPASGKEPHEFKQKIKALTLQNEELKAVLQGFVNEKHDQNTNQAINSLRTELEMIRDQADSDVQAMKEQLELAQCETDNLRLQLEQKKQRILELESHSTQNLTLQPDSGSLDTLVSLPENENGDGSLYKWAKNGSKLVFVALCSAVVAVVLVAGLIIGTESGQRLALSYLNVNTAENKSLATKQPETAETNLNARTPKEFNTDYGQIGLTPDNNVAIEEKGGNSKDQPVTGLDPSFLTESGAGSRQIVTTGSPDENSVSDENLTGQPKTAQDHSKSAAPIEFETLPGQPVSRNDNSISDDQKTDPQLGRPQPDSAIEPSVSAEPPVISEQPFLPASGTTNSRNPLPKQNRLSQTLKDLKETKDMIESPDTDNSVEAFDEF